MANGDYIFTGICFFVWSLFCSRSISLVSWAAASAVLMVWIVAFCLLHCRLGVAVKAVVVSYTCI